MPLYNCYAAGENFPGALLDQQEAVGFFVTITVEADDESDAEARALDVLRNHEKLRLPDGIAPPENAAVYFERIALAKEGAEEGDSGFVYYRME